MANKLIDAKDQLLEGKTVVVKGGRKFHCKDGFGCMPFLSGRKIFGHWDGNPPKPWDVISRWDVEFVEVEEEERSYTCAGCDPEEPCPDIDWCDVCVPDKQEQGRRKALQEASE